MFLDHGALFVLVYDMSAKMHFTLVTGILTWQLNFDRTML